MRSFTLTVLAAPTVRPGGDPNDPDQVIWPSAGRLVVLTVRELVEFFQVRHVAPGKFACPYFLVGAFTDGVRRNSAFRFASVIALDVEGGPTTQQAHATFRQWFHVIYTTWSHRAEAHRFRVVLPLARDVSAHEYKALWAWLAAKLDGGADPQTKDLARALFLPARRPDGRRAGSKAWEDAPLLDPDAVLAEARTRFAEAVARPSFPRPPASLQAGAALREARERLKQDTATRHRAALYLEGKVRGNRVDDIACPRCGRSSVWFWLEPGKKSTASCNHRNSCGWWGHLDALLDAAGGPRG
jgi:hypothetical protein